MFERAWHIGTFAKIPVKIHWTFLLIFVYVIPEATDEAGLMPLIIKATFLLTMFLCVVLHEFGHALTARRYGVKTEDIILLPIGGVARLRNLPEKPMHELVIAIMGPMVNVAIAIFLFTVLSLIYGFPFFSLDNLNELSFSSWEGFFPLLMITNIMLVLFNMIPAFPMDGGRVLRALLAMGFGKLKATRIASITGQIICVILVIAGIYYEAYTLAIIGVFIFMSATQEYRSVALDSAINNKTVKECYRTEFYNFTEYISIREAREFVMHRLDRTYPVINLLGQFSGSISAKQIIAAFKKNPEARISDIYNPRVMSLPVTTPLVHAMYALRNQTELILVTDQDQVIGVIDNDLIRQFIEIRTA
jgi:Zn-dependent protease